jgi:hypothetical protein
MSEKESVSDAKEPPSTKEEETTENLQDMIRRESSDEENCSKSHSPEVVCLFHHRNSQLLDSL